MATILVLGGTSFFGSRLVSNLTKTDHKVTVASRGKQLVIYDHRVERIIFDRKSIDSIKTNLGSRSWDIVIDQICYSPDDAKRLIEGLGKKIGHYIMTSSAYVYNKEGRFIKEDVFSPEGQEIKMGDRPDLTYEEGKRFAEVYIQKFATFPSAFARFPIVIGANDPTKRFDFHVNSIAKGVKIFHPNWDAVVSFISDLDAANCLQFLAESRLHGAFNFKSEDITFKEMMESISSKIGKKVLRGTENDGEKSPYSFSKDWILDIERIKKAGLHPDINLKSFIADLAHRPAEV